MCNFHKPSGQLRSQVPQGSLSGKIQKTCHISNSLLINDSNYINMVSSDNKRYIFKFTTTAFTLK